MESVDQPQANSFSTFESIIPVRPDDIDMNQHVHNRRAHEIPADIVAAYSI